MGEGAQSAPLHTKNIDIMKYKCYNDAIFMR